MNCHEMLKHFKIQKSHAHLPRAWSLTMPGSAGVFVGIDLVDLAAQLPDDIRGEVWFHGMPLSVLQIEETAVP